MKKWLLLLLWALAGLACAVQAAVHGGATVHQPAQRIVSLLPSLTESVCELGACDRLVGVDDYSNWPAPVRTLPRLGGLDDANIERIVALKPDLVLLGYGPRTMARLRSLGIKALDLEPKTVADVRGVLEQVARATGVGDANRVWERLQAELDAAARSLPPDLRGTTVYFEVNSGPYAAGQASFIGELLARIGAANIVPRELGPFPKLNPEFVVRADPQVIMISDFNAQSLKSRPGWDRIRAVRTGRVCRFTAAQSDALVRPGPRMAEAARLMVECLRGHSKAREP